jgi:hypothetical protein
MLQNDWKGKRLYWDICVQKTFNRYLAPDVYNLVASVVDNPDTVTVISPGIPLINMEIESIKNVNNLIWFLVNVPIKSNGINWVRGRRWR